MTLQSHLVNAQQKHGQSYHETVQGVPNWSHKAKWLIHEYIHAYKLHNEVNKTVSGHHIQKNTNSVFKNTKEKTH